LRAHRHIHNQCVDCILVGIQDAVVDDLATGVTRRHCDLAAVVCHAVGGDGGATVVVVIHAVAADAHYAVYGIGSAFGVYNAVTVTVSNGVCAVTGDADVNPGGP
jgi:hypothetical protein